MFFKKAKLFFCEKIVEKMIVVNEKKVPVAYFFTSSAGEIIMPGYKPKIEKNKRMKGRKIV